MGAHRRKCDWCGSGTPIVRDMEPVNPDYQYWCEECARALIIKRRPHRDVPRTRGGADLRPAARGALHAQALLFVRHRVTFPPSPLDVPVKPDRTETIWWSTPWTV